MRLKVEQVVHVYTAVNQAETGLTLPLRAWCGDGADNSGALPLAAGMLQLSL